MERFVIVGASLAGGTAAATLREEGFEGTVTLIGAEARPPYERPPLSKAYLRGEVPFEASLVHSEAYYRDHAIDLRAGVTAARVDTDAKTVLLEGGEPIPFDRLLVATGGRNRRFPIPGIDLPGVHLLRTVEDCDRIRAEVAPGRSAVLAGMGFIGSEVAASLRQKGVEVTVVDGGSVPLERVLGEQVGAALEGIHRDRGVAMVHRDRVAAFEGRERVERVITAEGRTLECDFVVAGMGVEPVADVVAGTPVEVDNGVVVDAHCRTNVEGVFAAGDVANHHNPVFGRRIRVEHWQNAMRHGRAAALSMLGRDEPYEEVYWFWSDQYDHRLEYAGYHTEWDDLVVRGSIEDRSFTAFYRKEGRVLACVTFDRPHEAARAVPLIRAGGLADRDRLLDEDVDLRTLAPASP